MDFWAALGRTLIYSAISVIMINVVAFLLAYMVTSGLKGQNFFRAGFFIPNLIGGIVLGYVWQFVFNRAFPVIFKGTTSMLGTSHGAMAALIIVSVWQYAGYMMLIYVAGFMSVSKSLIEAAQIDGCTPTQSAWYVTVPLMRSSFVQGLFLSITRCFMVYDVNLSLTKGEPYGSSVMAAMHVYNQAFTYKNYGVGQAQALILFVVCAVVGVTQVYIGKKGEEAALIDGCTRWKTWWRVVFPLLKPTIATVAIIDAMAFWNDYLLPSLVLQKKELYTIPIATQAFYGTYTSDLGLIMAALLLAMLPILILYVLLQRFIVEGVTSGAVKG